MCKSILNEETNNNNVDLANILSGIGNDEEEMTE